LQHGNLKYRTTTTMPNAFGLDVCENPHTLEVKNTNFSYSWCFEDEDSYIAYVILMGLKIFGIIRKFTVREDKNKGQIFYSVNIQLSSGSSYNLKDEMWLGLMEHPTEHGDSFSEFIQKNVLPYIWPETGHYLAPPPIEITNGNLDIDQIKEIARVGIQNRIAWFDIKILPSLSAPVQAIMTRVYSITPPVPVAPVTPPVPVAPVAPPPTSYGGGYGGPSSGYPPVHPSLPMPPQSLSFMRPPVRRAFDFTYGSNLVYPPGFGHRDVPDTGIFPMEFQESQEIANLRIQLTKAEARVAKLESRSMARKRQKSYKRQHQKVGEKRTRADASITSGASQKSRGFHDGHHTFLRRQNGRANVTNPTAFEMELAKTQDQVPEPGQRVDDFEEYSYYSGDYLDPMAMAQSPVSASMAATLHQRGQLFARDN